jgi:phosphate transport system permease protein
MNSNSKALYFSENIPKWIFGFIAAFTVAILLGIFVFLLISGLGTFKEIGIKEFLFGTDWNPNAFDTPAWGIFSLVVGTAMISLLALFIVVPFGLSIAIYLSEIASPKTQEILKPLVEMIASIPSVVLGFLGLLFLAPLIAKIFHLSNGLNALTASILVAIAALPTIASICEDALSSVSQRFREASLALGATQWATIKKIVIPAAKSGLIAGIMLGLGRVIGETMIVLMVAGNSRAFPHSLLDAVRPMTANIAIEIKEVVVGSFHWQSHFMLGFILFVITFFINFLADILIHKKSL